MKTVKMTMAVVCIAVCFMAALAFSGCSHGSSDTEDAVSNPFAGTEWSGGNASLKFYSDGTVSDGKNTANGLRYRVDSDGESYTATLYIDVNGYKSDMSTLTISSAGASSGQYKLSGSSYLVTLKKVGGSSDSGSSSSGGEGSSGSSGGSTASFDPFKGTEWKNNSDGSLWFSESKTVTFYNDMASESYSYKVTSNGDSYTAYLYAAGYENDSHSYSFAIYDKYSTSGRFCDSGNVQLDSFSMVDSFFKHTKWEGYKCSLTFDDNYECNWTEDGKRYKGNYSFNLSDKYIEAKIYNLRIDDNSYYNKELSFRISGENAQSGSLYIDKYSLTLNKSKYNY